MKGISYQQSSNQNATGDGGVSEFTSASGHPAVSDGTMPSISIDYALYEEFLEGSDWTEEQKCEFLDALWNIIVQFVDLGFGVHPLQQAGKLGDCGPFKEIAGLTPTDLLQLPDHRTKKN